jgi:hypothetical protein
MQNDPPAVLGAFAILRGDMRTHLPGIGRQAHRAVQSL